MKLTGFLESYLKVNIFTRDAFHRRLVFSFHGNRPSGHCHFLIFQGITERFPWRLLFSYFGHTTADSYYEFFIHHVFVLLMGKENISTFWFGL